MDAKTSEQFFDQLRACLLDVSRTQLDDLTRIMGELLDQQATALPGIINHLLDRQSVAVMRMGELISERLASLEREVAALREGRADEERGQLQ
jgi:hypothetical protein